MPTPKLLVRLKVDSRDADASNGNTIAVEQKDAIRIEESDPAGRLPWDDAHETVKAFPDYSFAEPDIDASSIFYSSQQEIDERGDPVEDDYYKFLDTWPGPPDPCVWHLDDDHSQLKKARDEVALLRPANKIRIAHFDTGYFKAHVSFPAMGNIIRHDLEKNFVDDDDEGPTAEDPFEKGKLKMPGHGTGTLSILAGTKVNIKNCDFDDYLGLHNNIEIVPIRVAKSVVLFKSAAFVRALDYIVNELYHDENKRVHVVTMSMGGVASRAWADLVNLAYERGIFIVTAAGNNFKKFPTRTMIYPARFNRVVAACGVTYDYTPYSKPGLEGDFHIMEVNYGPKSLMETAIAAFTPNVPWATYKFPNVVGIRGDGTSSATPQIASAAALYYMKYYKELEALPEPWMRVEAIRKALFDSAKKEINHDDGRFDDNYKKYYGNGILQAHAMLEKGVTQPPHSAKQKEDTVSFPFLKTLFGIRAVDDPGYNEEEMLETELMQLVLTDARLQEILGNEEKGLEELTKEEQRRVAEAVIGNERASDALKEKMQLVLNQLDI
jgi:hypothetical protein